MKNWEKVENCYRGSNLKISKISKSKFENDKKSISEILERDKIDKKKSPIYADYEPIDQS